MVMLGLAEGEVTESPPCTTAWENTKALEGHPVSPAGLQKIPL